MALKNMRESFHHDICLDCKSKVKTTKDIFLVFGATIEETTKEKTGVCLFVNVCEVERERESALIMSGQPSVKENGIDIMILHFLISSLTLCQSQA